MNRNRIGTLERLTTDHPNKLGVTITTLTATAVPTAIDGVAVPADQHDLAVAYMETIAVLGDTVAIAWQSPKSAKQVRAAHRSKSLVSHTTGTVERGGTYADRAGINAPEGLPYGAWLVPDHLILHNGQVLARVYAVAGTGTTTYTANGSTVSAEAWRGMVYASGKRSNPTGCLNVKLENILSISAA